jgi:hypothetical protein
MEKFAKCIFTETIMKDEIKKPLNIYNSKNNDSNNNKNLNNDKNNCINDINNNENKIKNKKIYKNEQDRNEEINEYLSNNKIDKRFKTFINIYQNSSIIRIEELQGYAWTGLPMGNINLL